MQNHQSDHFSAFSGIFGGYSQFTRSSTGSFQSEANQGLEDSNDGEGNLKLFRSCWILPKIHQGFCQDCNSIDGFDLQRHPTPLVFNRGGGLQQVEGADG